MSNSDLDQPAYPAGNTPPTTQEQILQAALACFAEKGYHKATMDDIVAASGLSKGTLYWHFKSKHELFISLIDWFLLSVSEEAAHAWTDDMSAADKIRALMMTVIANTDEIVPFFRVTIDFWSQTWEDEQLRERFDKLLDDFQMQLTAIIEEGISTGEFQVADASHLSVALLGMVDSLVLYRTLLGDKVEVQPTMEAMLDVLIRGLQG